MKFYCTFFFQCFYFQVTPSFSFFLVLFFSLLSPLFSNLLISSLLFSSLLSSLHLTSPHLSSPHLTSPHLTSPLLTSPPLSSPHLTSPLHTSPLLTSPHLTSPHLTSPHLTSPHLTSPLLSSPLLSLFFNFFQLAQVFIFQPPSEVRLVNRLKTIAALEGLHVSGDRTYRQFFSILFFLGIFFCHSFVRLFFFVFLFLVV